MTPTSEATLTDRYIDAVLRRLPNHQRPDIERELRASIADAIDDRAESGEDRVEAERAVLTSLGDPAKLAAGYADRPLYLIGPELFPDYVRLLTTLVAVVVPIVAAVVAVSRAFQNAPVGTIVGATISTTITTGAHVAFWTTLLFAALERVPGMRWPLSRPWTLADLPERPSRRARYAELVTLTVALVLFSTAILLSPFVSPESDDAGNPIGVLNPWLWETGIVYAFIGLVILSLGNAFAKYYGPKRPSMAIIGALVDMAGPIVLVWLATSDRLLNPAFVDAAGWTPAMRWVELGLVVSAGLAVLSAVVDAAQRIRNR